MNFKERAGEAALEYIRSGMNVGLGTGSTARYFIEALGREVKSGRFKNLRCVPTSIASEKLGRKLGLKIVKLAEVGHVDVTVDGADEVTPRLDLIKGLGGALLREKIVAQNTRKLIIIVDESKRVKKLGTRSPLPVEVVTYAHETQVPFMKSLGGKPVLRKDSAGRIFVTDNDNYIYDCWFAGGIKSPARLSDQFAERAGIVETGLFLNMARVALIAGENGIKVIRK